MKIFKKFLVKKSINKPCLLLLLLLFLPTFVFAVGLDTVPASEVLSADTNEQIKDMEKRVAGIMEKDNVYMSNHVESIYNLIDLYVQAGEDEKAFRLYREVLKNDSWNFERQEKFAELLWKSGYKAEAIEKAKLAYEYAEQDDVIDAAKKFFVANGINSMDEENKYSYVKKPRGRIVIVPVGKVNMDLLREVRDAMQKITDIDYVISTNTISLGEPDRTLTEERLYEIIGKIKEKYPYEVIRGILHENDLKEEDLLTFDGKIRFIGFVLKRDGAPSSVVREFEEKVGQERFLDKGQFSAERIISLLRERFKLNPQIEGYLGITASDIYAEGDKFDFSLSPKDYAIVSYYRFLGVNCGEGQNRPRLVERTAKAGINSSLFILGIERCSNPVCLRAFPMNVAEHDRKSLVLCSWCLGQIEKRLPSGFSQESNSTGEKNANSEKFYNSGKALCGIYGFSDKVNLTAGARCFRQAIDSDNNYFPAYVALSNTLLSLGYYGRDQELRNVYDSRLLEEAQGLIDRATAIKSDDKELAAAKANLFNARCEFNRAEEEIRHALKLGIDNPYFNIILGRILRNKFIDSKDRLLSDEATKCYRKALRAEADLYLKFLAYSDLGIMYLEELKNYNAAVHILQKALKFDFAGNKALREKLATAYLLAGRNKLAAAESFRIKDKNKILVLAKACSDRKDYDALKGLCEESLKIWPKDHELMIWLGYACEMKGNYDEALTWYEALKSGKPEMAYLYFRIGRVYDLQKKTDLSIENYQAALKLEPRDTDTLFNLARVYYEARGIDTAQEYYHKVLVIDPKRADVYYGLGCICYAKRDFEKAAEYLKKAVELGLVSRDNYLLLGNIYSKQNNYADAAEVLEKALKLKPDDTHILNDLAWAYVRSNVNLKKAASLASQALALSPGRTEVIDTYVEAHIKLSKVYIVSEEYDAAIVSAEKAVKMRPRSKEALDALSSAYAGKSAFVLKKYQFKEAVEAFFANIKYKLKENDGSKPKKLKR